MSDLPPLDQPEAWIVVRGTEQAGPYPLNVLIDEVVAQRLPDNTPVWWAPMADWTTLSAHPGVAAEIARRRALVTPGWAPPAPVAPMDPAPTGPTFSQAPVSSQPQMAQPQTAQSWSGGFPESPSVFEAQGASPQPVAEPAGATDQLVEADITDAEIVETPAAAQPGAVTQPAEPSTVVRSGLEGSIRADFASLVARSRERAARLEVVQRADEQLVAAAIAGAAECGFNLEERVDVNNNHEMRFKDLAGTGLLVISLAQLVTPRLEDISAVVLPVTVSVRIEGAQGASQRTEVAGEHGQITVRPDDWSGQTTSSVSLYLGASDYLGDDLAIDGAAMQRDFRAVIESVRTALG